MNDDDHRDLILTSVRQALARPPQEIAGALDEFGWSECVAMDEPFAFTALFEQQGHLGVSSPALDLAAAALLGIDSDVAVVWPGGADPSGGVDEIAVGDHLAVDGIALRSVQDPTLTLLVPVAGSVHQVAAATLEQSELGGMASGSDWVGIRGNAQSKDIVGSWAELVPKCRLAVASELVGLAQLILEVASDQVSTRQQFGRPIGANQAVRFQLAEGYADVSGARALVAAAWEDGSADSAAWARTVSGSVHGSLAKVAIQVCGAIGLSEEHQLPRLVRRGFALNALASASAYPPKDPALGIAVSDGPSPETYESVSHF